MCDRNTRALSQASDDESISSGGGKRWRSARGSVSRTLRTYSRASLATPAPRTQHLAEHLAAQLAAHRAALALPYDPSIWTQVHTLHTPHCFR